MLQVPEARKPAVNVPDREQVEFVRMLGADVAPRVREQVGNGP
jgi:hypothetical protein